MNQVDLFNLKWSFEHLAKICDKQQQGARRLVVRYCKSCPISQTCQNYLPADKFGGYSLAQFAEDAIAELKEASE